jgi:hypothetical protein
LIDVSRATNDITLYRMQVVRIDLDGV